MSEAAATVDDAAVEDDALYRIRHSLAHVLAMAVLEMRPGAELGFGPPIDDGFYYDFILPEPLGEDDFPELERRMRKIIGRAQPFSVERLPVPDALERLDEMHQPRKREYAEELASTQSLSELSFYRTDGFVDLCRGPHVEHTGKLPADAFKLRSIAGAYWRGDSDNPMMTRIYAWAFDSRKALEEHVRAYEEALKNDHRKLGRELEIYTIEEEVGVGLPMWLPNGAVLRDELENLAKEFEFKRGYQRVSTPVLARTELYHRSGHLPYYAEHMFPFMHVDETADRESGAANDYVLRPMNCPHHHLIFASRPRSHRELPLRLAEYGNVYRWEDSGAVSGLLRVRGMTMNDAHIYCAEEDIRAEFIDVMRMHLELYEILDLSNYYMRFSTWDPESDKGREKYVDDPDAWERTQAIVREALEELELDYEEGRGEAAFYGPKVDIQFRSVTGREETASTNQLDFAQPARFGLEYQGADNHPHRPYVIHRAPLGTHERFVAFLLERYGGAFPTWLAPVQVIVIPVSDRFRDYAARIVEELRIEDAVRAELHAGHEAVGKAIRGAIARKIPNVLVVGEREQAEEAVTLRRHGSREQEGMPAAEFRDRVARAIRTRAKQV
jgi:threonyl-tRNA synthetase